MIRSENPVRDAVIPRAKTSGRHLRVLIGRDYANAASATGASGNDCCRRIVYRSAARRVAGLPLEDYDGEQIRISQSYWRGHRQEPKTRKSRAPVPVIKPLAERLDLHRELWGILRRFDVPEHSKETTESRCAGKRCYTASVREAWP